VKHSEKWNMNDTISNGDQITGQQNKLFSILSLLIKFYASVELRLPFDNKIAIFSDKWFSHLKAASKKLILSKQR